MTAQELRKKTKEQLADMLKEKRGKLRDLRFSLASGKLKNIRGVRETKKDIAKILTVIKQKLEK